MTRSVPLAIVTIAGLWSVLSVVWTKGDRDVAWRVLWAHALGFPAILLLAVLLADAQGLDIVMLGVVEGLFVMAVLNLVHFVKWERPTGSTP